MIQRISALLKKERIKQSITLYLTMIGGVVLGIAISIFNTRFLGKEAYGDFKFIVNLYTFLITFLTFGFFYTSGWLLAKEESPQQKNKILSTVLGIATIIGLLFIVIVFGYSYLDKYIFGNEFERLIRYSLLLLFVFPFQLMLEQVLQGKNKIYSLSILRIGPKIAYLILVAICYMLDYFNLVSALLLHLFSFMIIIIFIVLSLKTHIRFDKVVFKKIFKVNTTYGFPIYQGAITGVASSYLAGITIGYFVDNVNVGYYSLAITATLPLQMLPSSFGITMFKDFVKLERIPSKVQIATYGIGIMVLIVFLAVIHKVVILLYTEEYTPVINLSYYLAIGSMFHGFGDFMNRFLGAKGYGKLLRNSNFILGIYNLAGYSILVYFYNTNGAAATRLGAGILYFLIMMYYYNRHLKQIKNNNDNLK